MEPPVRLSAGQSAREAGGTRVKEYFLATLRFITKEPAAGKRRQRPLQCKKTRSAAEAEDLLLRRAGPGLGGLRFRRGTGADFARRRRVVRPTFVERRQREV